MTTISSKIVSDNTEKEKKSSLSIKLLMLLCFLTVLAATGCGGGDGSPGQDVTTALPGIQEMLADKVLGDPDAPVTIIDYSALTCSHCADFHLNTLPEIKAKYIDTGKAKLIYRDFPFNQTGLTASMLARCSGEKSYFKVLDLMFRTQADWSLDSDPKKALVNILGMSQEKADACLADKELEDGLLKIQKDGQQQFGVSATPTFLINGQKIVGSLPFAEFDRILEGLSP